MEDLEFCKIMCEEINETRRKHETHLVRWILGVRLRGSTNWLRLFMR